MNCRFFTETVPNCLLEGGNLCEPNSRPECFSEVQIINTTEEYDRNFREEDDEVDDKDCNDEEWDDEE